MDALVDPDVIAVDVVVTVCNLKILDTVAGPVVIVVIFDEIIVFKVCCWEDLDTVGRGVVLLLFLSAAVKFWT
ncbi:hypothetical protein SK128_004877, partial [Halocaridina rubra]